MILAVLETGSFTFHALASSQKEALSLMRRAWRKHRQQTGAAPFSDFEDGLSFHAVELGTVLRDGSELIEGKAKR